MVEGEIETWQAIEAVRCADLLKKREQPIGLKAALQESVEKPTSARGRKR